MNVIKSFYCWGGPTLDEARSLAWMKKELRKLTSFPRRIFITWEDRPEIP